MLRALLAFHDVLHPSFRALLFINPPNPARLREKVSGREKVVDSW